MGDCNGNGIVVDDKCMCFTGYGDVECGGHGVCTNGTCYCEANWHVEPATGSCVASVVGKAAICGKSCTKQCLKQCPQDVEVTVYNSCITSCQRTCKNDCMGSDVNAPNSSVVALTPLN